MFSDREFRFVLLLQRNVIFFLIWNRTVKRLFLFLDVEKFLGIQFENVYLYGNI